MKGDVSVGLYAFDVKGLVSEVVYLTLGTNTLQRLIDALNA